MKPETVGMSSARLARLDEVMKRRYVDGGYLPGMLTYIYRKGQLVHTGLCGQMDIERDKKLREDAIFRVYSMSKPITAVALMILVEGGLIGLDDAVHSHIPEWKDLGVYASGTPSLLADSSPSYMTTLALRPMKIVDLATHTSGLTYGFMMRTAVDAAYRRAKVVDRQTPGGLEGMIDQLAKIPLDFSPGTAWNYSVSIDVLGYLVQKLSGLSFGEFLRTRLFEPLGMLSPQPKFDTAGTFIGSSFCFCTAQDFAVSRLRVERAPSLADALQSDETAPSASGKLLPSRWRFREPGRSPNSSPNWPISTASFRSTRATSTCRRTDRATGAMHNPLSA